MTGLAYAFFDCRAEIARVNRTVKDVVAINANSLDGLLLTLMDIRDPDAQTLPEPGSEPYFEQAWDAGFPYVIKATSPSRTGAGVADDLALVLNQAYQSELYEKDEPFRGEILYAQGDGTFSIHK